MTYVQACTDCNWRGDTSETVHPPDRVFGELDTTPYCPVCDGPTERVRLPPRSTTAECIYCGDEHPINYLTDKPTDARSHICDACWYDPNRAPIGYTRPGGFEYE